MADEATNDGIVGSEVPIPEAAKRKLKRLRKRQRECMARIADIKEEMKEAKLQLDDVNDALGTAIDGIDQGDLPGLTPSEEAQP